MTPTVQVGSILIGDLSPRIAEMLTLESEPYVGPWSVVTPPGALELESKLHAAGWNFFFLAAEVKVMFFGAIGATKIRDAVRQILRKVKRENFNCLEVTHIVAKRFWGIPYATVTAHSRHIQQSCQLDDIAQRRASERDVEWAKS